jgi:hypothetical protein
VEAAIAEREALKRRQDLRETVSERTRQQERGGWRSPGRSSRPRAAGVPAPCPPAAAAARLTGRAAPCLRACLLAEMEEGMEGMKLDEKLEVLAKGAAKNVKQGFGKLMGQLTVLKDNVQQAAAAAAAKRSDKE